MPRWEHARFEPDLEEIVCQPKQGRLIATDGANLALEINGFNAGQSAAPPRTKAAVVARP